MKEDITKWIWQHKDYPNFKYNKLELTDLLTLITQSWMRFITPPTKYHKNQAA